MRTAPILVAATFTLLACPDLTGAQGRQPPESGGNPSPGQLVVRVRTATGAPLAGHAMVRLYDPVGSLELRTSTGEGAQAVFRGIPVGGYRVEVTAPGYQRTEEDAELLIPGSTVHVFINLTPESGASSPPPGPPVLTGKAANEAEAGLRALQNLDYEAARRHLEKALKRAPANPQIHYLLGVLWLRLNDLPKAKEHLRTSLNLDPGFRQASIALGLIHYRDKDYPGAIRLLEPALAREPGNWETEWSLASSYYHQQKFEKAVVHAERAKKLSSEKIPEISLLLIQALAANGQNDKALEEMEEFLRQQPQHAAAIQVRKALEMARQAGPRAEVSASVEKSKAGPAPTHLGTTKLQPSLAWMPRDVEAMVPPVREEVTCPVTEVLDGAAHRAVSLAQDLEQISATEKVEHTEIDPTGVTLWKQDREFHYMVAIRRVGPQLFSVEESRNGGAALDGFRAPMVTTGLAAMALLAHPFYRDDFEMRCEGLGQWGDRPAWQIYFHQREDRPGRVRTYHTPEGRFPIALKGRAWIATNTFHLLRLETGLVRPMREIRLEREHLVVEYAPVDFAERKLRLWLPRSAELYAQFRGRQIHQQHSFRDFIFYSVDVNQKIHDPKEP